MNITCSKRVNADCANDAVEFLLVRVHPYGAAWEAKPRCTEHPAADDIPLLRRVHPAAECLIVPVGLHMNYNTIYTALKALWDSTSTSPEVKP